MSLKDSAPAFTRPATRAPLLTTLGLAWALAAAGAAGAGSAPAPVGAAPRQLEPVAATRPLTVPGRRPGHWGRPSLAFEENRGQAAPAVRFLARASRFSLGLVPGEMVVTAPQPPLAGTRPAGEPRAAAAAGQTQAAVRIRFRGARAGAGMEGLARLPGSVNYFVGDDAAKWITRVPTWAKVRYRDLYPGVDLVVHGEEGQLEYDLMVQPFADPGCVRWSFQGTDRLEVDAAGDLTTAASTLSLPSSTPRAMRWSTRPISAAAAVTAVPASPWTAPAPRMFWARLPPSTSRPWLRCIQAPAAPPFSWPRSAPPPASTSIATIRGGGAPDGRRRVPAAGPADGRRQALGTLEVWRAAGRGCPR
jgi:hypothetical protein